MVDSAWSIRFFQANNYKDDGTIDFASNFKKGKSRQLDTVMTYSGMYGIDNYLVWNIHKDLPNYDFSTVALNLNLCLYKNPEIVYFQEFYRVQDIRYNPNKSQYTLYAISETTVKLHSKLIDYNVTSLSYKEDRKASDLIREVIEDNNIFYVVYHEDTESTKDMIDYEYRYFNIDPEWTVLDFIEYICNDNMYEWCLDKRIDEDNVPTEILHFGHEIKAMKDRNATKDFELERDNISQSVFAMKITTDGSPMEPLAHWEERLRCIWSKHVAGKSGGISRGCFVPIGMGHFDKFLYLKTLEGEIEKNIGYAMLSNPHKNRISAVKIGNIIQDEGDPQFIDIVSVQKNPDLYPITEPHNILVDRGDDIAVQHQKEHVTRSTPYLDHEAGLLFPSSKLENPPPNSLIFNVDGKAESGVVGPFIMGDGRVERDEEGKPTGNPKLIIPSKLDKADLRLQLPNGWCLYTDKLGNTYLSIRDIDSTITPMEMDILNLTKIEGMYFKVAGDDGKSELRIGLDQYNFITMRNEEDVCYYITDGVMYIKGNKEVFLQVDATDFIRILPDNVGEKKLTISTNINDIVIQSLDGGTININTVGGVVNVGDDATAVNLAGGSKAFPLKDHTHPINCKPGPPTSTQKSIDDNTTKTKAT